MKFKTIIFVIVNILMIVIMSIFTYNQHYFTGETTLKTYFEAVDAEEYTKTVLFYTSSGSEFVDEQAVEGKIVENVCVISLNDIDMSDTILRLDPINCQGTFSITNIEVLRGNKIILSLSGKKLKSYIDDYYGISKKWENGVLVCEAKNEDPMIFFKQALCDKIDMYQYRYARNIYIVILAIYVCIGIAEVICLAGKEMKKRTYIITSVVTGALIIAAIVILYAGRYFRKQFGQVPFGQLLYHLNTPLEGTDLSSYHDVIWIGVGIAVICLIAYVVLLNLLKKKRAQKGYMLWIAGLAFVLTSYSGVKIVQQFDIVEYYEYIHQKTTLYDDYYVDGRDVELTFPENKRNLIYIFLESMEITYADVEVGGAMECNYIEELTELALENNCFSEGETLNGPYHVNGATFTMGALAAQTSGVPINETLVSNKTLNATWESENNYLPGVWSIGDVLEEQGYNQMFLIGSVGEFAGRSSYFKGHGGYVVEDYNAAIERGRISEDYKVWWGYEDEKLFEYAKEELLNLAGKDEPFNFTMLTADTHPVNGYYCRLCEDNYSAQYTNVIACSSCKRQVLFHKFWRKRFKTRRSAII